jgi:hypothetical protein
MALRRLSLGARLRRRALAPAAPWGHWGLTAQRRPSGEARMPLNADKCPQFRTAAPLAKEVQGRKSLPRVLALDPPHISPRLCRGLLTYLIRLAAVWTPLEISKSAKPLRKYTKGALPLPWTDRSPGRPPSASPCHGLVGALEKESDGHPKRPTMTSISSGATRRKLPNG